MIPSVPIKRQLISIFQQETTIERQFLFGEYQRTDNYSLMEFQYSFAI